MLPWKKHKFELLAEAPPRQASKPKGYAVSLHYSALSSLARACPEGALSRVGSMFRSKRKKLHITSEDPTYTVLYLGNATTIQARGDGCTDLAVGKIWSKSEAGRQGTKMKLTVSAQGIRMVHAEERALRRPGHLYLLHRVTYCVADARLPKVFAWVYRHELKHKAVMLRCHAVLVSKPEKAQAMALLLYQTSANALAEFKRLKRRDDARHQQQELVGAHTIPLVPLRKLLLHGSCCYKPPVERSRSALGVEGPAEEETEAQRALVVAMHFQCGDLLDTMENGREEMLGGGVVSLGPGLGTPPPLSCSASEVKAQLSQLINDLGELSFGNDVRTLQADLRVTRLLSGESTGSESSIEGGGPDATSTSAGNKSGSADSSSPDEPHSG
uniref:Family with sequence similarity 43 member A n=1 Tax=Spermophilus dauricus TaxID=99837 RepID=A0A8C9PQ32_SPEDA